jgi:hypothetical protein
MPRYAHPRVSLLRVGALLLLNSLAACTTYGHLYVGHPQVHTRERLIEERYGEVEWLRKQLAETDRIELRFQGIRDYREFVGFYNELTAKVDPSRGALNQMDLENEKLQKSADYWRLKQAEYNSRKKYQDAVDAKALVDDPEESGSKGANGSGSGVSATAPFGRKASELPGLPDPASPQKTKADAGLLDLFHDKLAYRNAVNSAIKGTQLDDAHDQMGLMLYQLNFAVSMVPGSRSTQFAQVNLSIEPDLGSEREASLRKLYENWRKALRSHLIAEVARLQTAYLDTLSEPGAPPGHERASKLSWKDLLFLEKFISQYEDVRRLQAGEERRQREALQKTLLDLVRSFTRPRKNNCDAGSDEEPGQNDLPQEVRDRFYEFVVTNGAYPLVSPAILESDRRFREAPKGPSAANKALSDPGRELVTAVLEALGSTPEQIRAAMESQDSEKPAEKEPASAKPSPQQDGKKSSDVRARVRRNLRILLRQLGGELDAREETTREALRLIPWAVWRKYKLELARYVEIHPPFDTDAVATSDEALQLKESSLAVERVIDVYSDPQGTSILPPQEGANFVWAYRVPASLNLGNLGRVAFVQQLLEIEKRPYAVSIEPQEYAQNVSEAAARHNVLNLIAGVHALIPQAGVDLGDQTQYVRDTQEILHSITRKPLLVGFGQGRRDFGWVMGPKYIIAGGRAEFAHVPVRHDCSASIVVPAWWTFVDLKGRYVWIDNDGESATKPEPLWGDPLKPESSGIRLRLPLVKDPWEKVTQALVGWALSGELFAAATRPLPEIESPTQAAPAILRVGKTQHILIMGRDLWRNPQVFAGGQRASRVDILSDMEAIHAHFDSLYYPDGGSKEGSVVDLTVITTFGRHTIPGAVRILPEEGKEKPTPPATLTPLVVKYSPNEQTKAEIVLRIKKGSAKPDFAGYEDLSAALSAGRNVNLVVIDNRGYEVRLPAQSQEHPAVIEFTVTKDSLNKEAIRKEIFGKLAGGKAVTVELEYLTRAGLPARVRTVSSEDEAKAGSLTFVQDPPPPAVLSAAQIAFKAGQTSELKLTISSASEDNAAKLYPALEETIRDVQGVFFLELVDKSGKKAGGLKLTKPAPGASFEFAIDFAALAAEKKKELLDLEDPCTAIIRYEAGGKPVTIKTGQKEDKSKEGQLSFVQQ